MNTYKIPFYARTALIFIGLFAFVAVLYIGQHIIVPIVISGIIAILLSSMVSFLVKKRMNRILAIIVSLSTVCLTLILLVVLLSSQLTQFSDAFPRLLSKFYEFLNKGVLWASESFNISIDKINIFIVDTKAEIIAGGRSSIGATLSIMGSAVVVIFLIPVYIFMILFYQPLLLEFIRKLFGKTNENEVNEILTSTKSVIQRYLVGLLLEALIIATLNSVGLLIMAIEYAVVLGILGAILNIIPYLGGIIAMGIYMVIAMVTKDDAIYILYIWMLYSGIQIIDNNFIVSKVVGSKIKINAFIAIVVIICGEAIWGIPGMFLSLPLTAIAKLIFDRIEGLKPWGLLLGDTMPAIVKYKIKLKK